MRPVKFFLAILLLFPFGFGCSNSDGKTSQIGDAVQLVLDSLVSANELPGANFSLILSDLTE